MDADASRRLGAAEGTGLGFMAAGAILAMAWLGEQLGTVFPIEEGRWALLFLGIGTATLLIAMRRD